jgi:hypothetical protein
LPIPSFLTCSGEFIGSMLICLQDCVRKFDIDYEGVKLIKWLDCLSTEPHMLLLILEGQTIFSLLVWICFLIGVEGLLS